MQTIIQNLDSNRIFILGVLTTNNGIEQKYLWLKENYPNLKKDNIFFICSTLQKPKVIMEVYKHYNLPLELADISIYLMRLSEMLGFDLVDEIEKKVSKNEKRVYKNIEGINVRISE